jgi:hypothetical protein
MCQGEYHLIDDQPDDARKCFEGACRVATSKASQVRNAMEGVARAIRDQNGSAAPANAFIESIRNDPGAAGAALIGTTADSPSRSDLKSVHAAVGGATDFLNAITLSTKKIGYGLLKFAVREPMNVFYRTQRAEPTGSVMAMEFLLHQAKN